MSKRAWADVDSSSPGSMASSTLDRHASVTSHSQYDQINQSPGPVKKVRTADRDPPKENDQSNRVPPSMTGAAKAQDRRLPTVSRKVKACAACRKQKIKCQMQGDPPCQRCKERGLSCRLNKSLQTLMSEDWRWKLSVAADLANMHNTLDQVLKAMSLPLLPPLQTSAQEAALLAAQDDQANEQDEEDQSYDNSPKVSPMNENLAHIPIESLYQITGLRSLRVQEPSSEELDRICKQLRDTDFISRGLVSVEDAEYLTGFYMERLDPYIWHLTRAYKDLDSFRRKSPTLTACMLTVAALHDTSKPHLYSICFKEFRRLVANAMFERHIDLEYLRALVIGSYWLSDVSWTLSGYAIRRASEFHLQQSYVQICESTRDPDKYTHQQLAKAMDAVRLLYLLYICDHHLSVLYGRPSIMRDNENYIIGWETYLASSLASDSDKRIASQVSLMFLMNRIRESFGPEDTSVLPASAVTTIANFEHDLDNWVSRHTFLGPHNFIGNWPTRGVVIHYNFCKLYLGSFVFRGLSESNPMIPDHFLETASAAVAAATSIVTLLLEDETLQNALAGVPHYFHGMVSFACMWLLKVATKHSAQLYIDLRKFDTMIQGLSQQLKFTKIGRDHLIHRMAEGLEKMAKILNQKLVKNGTAAVEGISRYVKGEESMERIPPDHVATNLSGSQAVPGFGALDNNSFDLDDPSLALGMSFFDFEGNLGLDEVLYNPTS